MVVFTYFDDMAALVDAIAEEAFARFAQALTEVPQTDDPVADFFALGFHSDSTESHTRISREL